MHDTVINRCGGPRTVSLVVAYFWKDGSQAGTSLAIEFVAGGAKWNWVVVPENAFWPIKGARVIDVLATP